MNPQQSSSYPPEKGNTNWSNDQQSAPYNPATYGRAPSPLPQDRAEEGTLVLVDENGNQVGALGEHINVAGVVPGSQDPVEIDLSRTDGIVTVRPVQADYLRDSQDPAYVNSRLVGTAATASRVLVTGASYVGKALEAGARTFTEKTKPVNTPMTFQPTTHNYVRQVHNYSATGANVVNKTVGTVTHHAQNIGARLAGKGEGHQRSPNSKPGLINKGLIAFGTLADGIEYASKLILTSGSQAATTVVGHRYGAEAEQVARGLTGVVKNVGLVYIDASGVSRRAVVKSVAKGMVVGRVKGGGEVVFDGNNTSQAVLTQPGPQPGPGLVGQPGSPIYGSTGQFQSFTPPPPQYGGSGHMSPLPPQHVSGRTSPMPHPQQQFPPPQHVSGRTSPMPPPQQQFPPPQQQYNPAAYKY